MWSSSAPASEAPPASPPPASPSPPPAPAAVLAPTAVAALIAGVVAAGVVLSPPFDAIADRHLAAHMLQHVVLLSVTAPLLALAASRAIATRAARPSPVVGVRPESSSGKSWRSWASWRSWSSWSPVRAVVAVVAIGLAVPLWHVPALYDAADSSLPLHVVEHATYVAVAAWFWFEVIAGYRAGVVPAFVALCAGAAPGTLLGFLMTFATSPWYPHYAALPSAVEDQQIAGVVMWAGGNVATLIAVCAVFAGWLRRLDREPPSNPGRASG